MWFAHQFLNKRVEAGEGRGTETQEEYEEPYARGGSACARGGRTPRDALEDCSQVRVCATRMGLGLGRAATGSASIGHGGGRVGRSRARARRGGEERAECESDDAVAHAVLRARTRTCDGH